jgi:hypothetical protein
VQISQANVSAIPRTPAVIPFQAAHMQPRNPARSAANGTRSDFPEAIASHGVPLSRPTKLVQPPVCSTPLQPPTPNPALSSFTNGKRSPKEVCKEQKNIFPLHNTISNELQCEAELQ